MLKKGQLSTAFLLHMAVGFMLLITITYATISLDESMKRQNMEKALSPVGEYLAVNMLNTISQMGMGRSVNQTLRVPMSEDFTSGQYSMGLEDVDGMWYVAVYSSKWPSSGILQPLYLNTSYVSAEDRLQFPPYFCFNITRNSTAGFAAGDNLPKYHIYFNC